MMLSQLGIKVKGLETAAKSEEAKAHYAAQAKAIRLETAIKKTDFALEASKFKAQMRMHEQSMAAAAMAHGQENEVFGTVQLDEHGAPTGQLGRTHKHNEAVSMRNAMSSIWDAREQMALIIAAREKYGWELLNRSAVNRMKSAGTQARLSYANSIKSLLGRLSEKDLEMLETISPDPTSAGWKVDTFVQAYDYFNRRIANELRSRRLHERSDIPGVMRKEVTGRDIQENSESFNRRFGFSQ